MSIIRIEKTKDYTVMSNYHLREKGMSLKAKGLMSLMLSLPDDWDYSIAGLVAICKENETSIKTALDELKEFGYLEVIKKKPDETESGRLEYEYVLHEQKQDTKKQGLENLGVEILGVEILGLENPPQSNTNIQSTKKLNTKNIKENTKEKEIFDFWNSQHIQTHQKLTDEMQKAIDKALKTYSMDEIKTAIQRYGTIYNSNYYWHYQWRLDDFLKQKNALPDFLDEGSKWLNYKNRRKDPKVLHEQEYTQEDYDGVFDTFRNMA